MSPERFRDPLERIRELERRLEEAEETIRALRQGAKRLVVGDIECISVVATDLTGQKRSEELTAEIAARERLETALRESEARERERAGDLEALLEAVPVAVLISRDRECRHISGNRMAHELLRLPRGTNLSSSASEAERPARFRAMQNGREISPEDMPAQIAARTGRTVNDYELNLVFDDGTRLDLLGSAVPLLDENGTPRGAVAAGIDVTERKRAEEALRQAQKLESIGLLAGGIAHDFNNLLVSVIGGASLARESLKYDSSAVELLDTIVKTGEEAALLTRQLLAYSGKGQFVIAPLDLSQAVREISNLIRPSISKRISLSLDLDNALPLVEADRGQIQQVVMNLALNAAEAIGNAAGVISVRTSAQRIDRRAIRAQAWSGIEPGNYVVLEVRDTGCGMDEETSVRIFDPFFTTKFMGRGLGLAAVSGIVRGHRGAIQVTSSPGQGACFTVLFPPAERPAAAAVSVPAEPAVRLQGSGTILVVDDEPGVRKVAEAALRWHGFEVLAAASGAESIEIFKESESRISLVLLDLSMPGMGGEEALAQMVKIRDEVKVLVSSGYSEAESMAAFEGLPVSGFIQKPYTSDELAQKIIDTLG